MYVDIENNMELALVMAKGLELKLSVSFIPKVTKLSALAGLPFGTIKYPHCENLNKK